MEAAKPGSRLLALRDLDEADEHDLNWHNNFNTVQDLLKNEVGAIWVLSLFLTVRI